MQLVEQHIVTKENKFFKECDELCFKSKNLYNSSLYLIKNHMDDDSYLYDLYYHMKESEQYRALPAKISASILLMVKQNIKAHRAALRSYKKTPKKFKAEPQFPHYLAKV